MRSLRINAGSAYAVIINSRILKKSSIVSFVHWLIAVTAGTSPGPFRRANLWNGVRSAEFVIVSFISEIWSKIRIIKSTIKLKLFWAKDP
jgi:hypothetical protein